MCVVSIDAVKNESVMDVFTQQSLKQLTLSVKTAKGAVKKAKIVSKKEKKKFIQAKTTLKKSKKGVVNATNSVVKSKRKLRNAENKKVKATALYQKSMLKLQDAIERDINAEVHLRALDIQVKTAETRLKVAQAKTAQNRNLKIQPKISPVLVIPEPVMVINLASKIRIKKTRLKKGISGRVENVKQLFIINDTEDTVVSIRPDNKFYIVMPLPQKETFKFKFKAIGNNGKKVIRTVVFTRQ